VRQAQLDAALAHAFSSEPPVPVFSLVEPSQAGAVFTVEAAAAEAAVRPAPHPMPAPASLMAAAPPLPGHLSPFAPPAPEPESAAPVPAAFFPPATPMPAAAPVAPVAGSSLPFSPFGGLEPAPPPPSPEPGFPALAPKKGQEAEASWPSSPFFGSAQAATAPFRMVEPPPVIASTLGEMPPVAPLAPALPPVVAVAPVTPSPSAAVPASFPPIPGEGQGFNFAELLRANGQR
jgi:hypothetical protein